MRPTGWLCVLLLGCGAPSSTPPGGAGPSSGVASPTVVAPDPGTTAGSWHAATQVGDEGTPPPGPADADGPGVDWATRCPLPATSEGVVWRPLPAPFAPSHEEAATHAVSSYAIHLFHNADRHFAWSATTGAQRLPLGPLVAAPDVALAVDGGLVGLVDHGDEVEHVTWAPGVGWAPGDRVRVDAVHGVAIVGGQPAAHVVVDGQRWLLRLEGSGYQLVELPDEVPDSAVIGASAEGAVLAAWFDGTELMIYDGSTRTVHAPWSAEGATAGLGGTVQLAGRDGDLAALFEWSDGLWLAHHDADGWSVEEVVASQGALVLGPGVPGVWLEADDRFAGALGVALTDDGVRLLYSELTRQGAFSAVAGDGEWVWDSPGLQSELVAERWSVADGLSDRAVLATGLPAVRGQLVAHEAHHVVRLHVFEHCEEPLRTRPELVRLDAALWPAP